MANIWLRLYTETLNDPKVQQLDGDVFKFWINLLCIAKEYDRAGQLPPISDLSFKLRVTRDVTRDMLETLQLSGLIEEDGAKDLLCIHSWETRQFVSDGDPTALERKRRQRDKLKNVTDLSRVTSRTDRRDMSQDVTRTEQNRAETETEQNSLGREEIPLEPMNGRRQNPGRTELAAYIETWNLSGLAEYRRAPENVPNLGEVLESCSWYEHDEVLSAISCYAAVIQTPDLYDMKFPYQTILSFLQKGLEKFAPSAKPLEVFKRKATNGYHHAEPDVVKRSRELRGAT